MIRNLVERLPVVVCPKWVYTRVCPLTVEDLLDYLVCALKTPKSDSRNIAVGGRTIASYRGMVLAGQSC